MRRRLFSADSFSAGTPGNIARVSRSRCPFVKHADDRRARARVRAVFRVRDRAADCVRSCIPNWAVSQPIADQIKAVLVFAGTDLVNVLGGASGHFHPIVCSPKSLSDGLYQSKAVVFGTRGFHRESDWNEARGDKRKMSTCTQAVPRGISNVSLVSGISIVHDCLISLPLFWLSLVSRHHFWWFTEVVRKMRGEVTRKCTGDATVTSASWVRRGVRRPALRS